MEENEIFKSGKISGDVAPRTIGILKTSIQFCTQDQGTAKLIFSLSKDGLPLSLSSAATGKIFLRMADGSVFEKTVSIVDQINGKLEYVLQEEISHPGLAKGELNINYTNGQAMSVCKFSFNIDASFKDQNIVPLAEYYVKDFNTLKTDIEHMDVDEMQTKVNEFESTAITLDSRLTTVEGEVETVTAQLAETTQKIKNIRLDIVEDFGADPTGDTLSQTAIEYALATGRKIHFPEGTFLINSMTINNARTQITADEGAIIKANSIVDGLVTINASRVFINENLTINGDNKASTGIRVKKGVDHVTVKCKVKNIYSPNFKSNGIHIEGETNHIRIESEIDNIHAETNGIEGDNFGAVGGVSVSPSGYDTNGNPLDGAPSNIFIKNSSITNIYPREDGDGISVQGWNNQKVSVTIQNNYFNYCAKRAIKTMCAGVRILDNEINNPYIGNVSGNRSDCMFAFVSIFGDDVVCKRNKMYGGSVYTGIEIGTPLWKTKGIKVKDNEIVLDTTGIKPFYGVISFLADNEDLEISGNTLANGNQGILGRGRVVNALINGNTIKGASEQGILFDNTNYVLMNGINIYGNKILSSKYGIQLQSGEFLVTGNDGVTGWEFTNISATASAILKGNKSDLYYTLPTASIFYRGHTITLIGDATYDDRTYVCVKLANSNNYAWKQLTTA
ncbi:BppU family phage baseplate upper protein [Peribacillus frigoritolerans]|uniref:BppU family phage baseplate upper protein n=1 Tax=Peribacillus frigoritolerans TaxID=450367 RepID=UPI002E230488|nr:BppU family phage baseplate upper protein [Peribacillus frigoritolerans]